MSISNDNVPKGLYGKVRKTEEIEYKGKKGLLVWDAILVNEITFQENVTNKKTSLYTYWSDSEAEEMFDKYVSVYKVKDK